MAFIHPTLIENAMEEIEVPTEHLHEQIKEKTSELLEKGEGKSFLYIAISTALMAVFAAIAGLMAGHHSNEALIDQIRASDQWAYYQAKSIKAQIRLLRTENGQVPVKSPEQQKLEEEAIAKKAESFEHSSEAHLGHHVWLARSVLHYSRWPLLFRLYLSSPGKKPCGWQEWCWHLAGLPAFWQD